MITIPVYTIREILMTPTIKYNQTTLANLLDIQRTTLRKYKDDTDNSRHSVLFIDGKYIFMHITAPHSTRRTQ